eukprot:349641-Chlamydomonas_euryale.AAC.16
MVSMLHALASLYALGPSKRPPSIITLPSATWPPAYSPSRLPRFACGQIRQCHTCSTNSTALAPTMACSEYADGQAHLHSPFLPPPAPSHLCQGQHRQTHGGYATAQTQHRHAPPLNTHRPTRALTIYSRE